MFILEEVGRGNERVIRADDLEAWDNGYDDN